MNLFEVLFWVLVVLRWYGVSTENRWLFLGSLACLALAALITRMISLASRRLEWEKRRRAWERVTHEALVRAQRVKPSQ